MKKVLVVLSGESFKDGGTGVRSVGNNEYFIRQQFFATDSHIRLMDQIESLGYKCDVVINSYKSNRLEIALVHMYGDRVVGYNFHEHRLKDEYEMIEDTTQRIGGLAGFSEYDSVLFIRLDLYLKKYFIDSFRLDSGKVMYAFLDSNPSFNMICNGLKIPRCDYFLPVTYFITLVPNKYFDLMLNNKVWYWHYSGSRLMEQIKDDPTNHIGFFVDTLHWSSSSIEWNPIFVQAARPNSKKYEECKQIQVDVDPNRFIIASKGLRYDFINNQRYIVQNDKTYDDAITSEISDNKNIEFFY